jgi:hypothetical protein
MRKKLNSTIILIMLALGTGAALIAFAFNQRHGSPVTVPAVAFYAAAAIICLGSEFYARLRRRNCRNKTANLG